MAQSRRWEVQKNLPATYTDGLDESETQNGVGEELTTERWVAGDGREQGSEDQADTDTGLLCMCQLHLSGTSSAIMIFCLHHQDR